MSGLSDDAPDLMKWLSNQGTLHELPELAGYDMLATWREVTRRLGTRLWIYINVIDEPYLIDKHPDWQRVDAKGDRSRVCNRASADGSG